MLHAGVDAGSRRSSLPDSCIEQARVGIKGPWLLHVAEMHACYHSGNAPHGCAYGADRKAVLQAWPVPELHACAGSACGSEATRQRPEDSAAGARDAGARSAHDSQPRCTATGW